MLGEARARSAIRVSLGEDTTADLIDEAIVVFERVLLRRLSR
jgi:cysteine sulfinate desulfinase/cysteine desulfurase-like protein